MTRPPNKRVSRGQPIRRGGQPAKKGNGCPLTVLLLPYYLIYALVSLLTPAQRHRPQPLARARAAVGGTAGGGPTN